MVFIMTGFIGVNGAIRSERTDMPGFEPWLGRLVEETLKRSKGLARIQKEINAWREYNFPDSTPTQQFLGVVEETGELSHAILKGQQGIRGYSPEDTAEIKDAIGDLLVFLANFCSMNDWDMLTILQDVWEEVKQRDWQKNPKTGKVVNYIVDE